MLNFNYFELRNITFNQKILFSNAVVDLLNHSGFLVWISPISAASRLQCFLTLLSQMWPLLIWGQCLIRGRLIPVNWVKNLSQFSWAFCDVNHAIIFFIINLMIDISHQLLIWKIFQIWLVLGGYEKLEMNNKVIFSSRQFSIQDLLTSTSTVLVLLRHFAWLPWRDHVAQVEACKAKFEAHNGQVVVISFGNVVSIKLACFADWLSRYIVLRVSIDSTLNRGRSRGRVQGVCLPPPPNPRWPVAFQYNCYSVLEFVYVTSQLLHSLEVQPLQRKILDLPQYYFILFSGWS